MNVDRLLTLEATVSTVTDSTADRYNDPTETATTSTVPCYLEQRRTTDETTGLSVASADWLGIFPASVALTDRDRLAVAGSTYQVYGDPWPVHDPRTGTTSHVEANLRRTS